MSHATSLRLTYQTLAARGFLPSVGVLFAVSGFAGLIYESIWSHYLKLFLGHAAYAQTVVLAIFMGGMALGAWLASRISRRWRNLLLAYAVVEALVGIASLLFHEVFLAVTQFAFDIAIPALGAPTALKWTLAALLILPQSVLLGMTFPLLTAGVLRAEPHRQGYAIAMLYFANSLGAGIGVLASGFYLIPTAGLPGTLLAAAVLNLSVAAAVALLPRPEQGAVRPASHEATPSGDAARLARTLLVIVALTGMSSFMYEIGWIRMLSLVLGSSAHAFEIMLSAFILGLAFGGLWVRRRIDSGADSLRLLAFVQLAMGAAALATLPVYGSTFNAMQWVLATLRPTESGYAAFNLVSHALCLAVMFPAAFCAGMTLPLVTVALLRRGAGERAIGQVYAANTLGAIAGVALAVHFGLPLLGMKGLIIAGAFIDLALGVYLLGLSGRALRAGAFAGSLAALLCAALFVNLDAHKLASGVFRHGHILDARQSVVFQEDGKTATISITGHDHGLTLRTNGKPDGSVRRASTLLSDEHTQVLLGALPLYYAPQARRIGSIGFGTGVTAHVLLAGAHVEVLDTVEIEPAVVRAAPHFLPHNERALSDPRSRVHFEDAKTFFSSRRASYDVIVSEPSNPWVSGVASLFTDEFYRDVRRYLREGGLFVQWLHLYETTPVLLASIVAAMRPHFSDYAVWAPNEGDLVFVAVNGGALPKPDAGLFRNAALAQALAGIGVRNADELASYRVAGRAALAPYFASFGAPPNSDFHPFLDVQAARARFMGAHAREVLRLREAGLPLLEWFDRGNVSAGPLRRDAIALESYILRGDAAALTSLPASMRGDAEVLRRDVQRCRFEAPAEALRLAFMDAALLVNGQLPQPRAAAFWRTVTRNGCLASLPEGERRWVRLHAAVSVGDPRPVAEAARAVLEAEPDLADRPRAYALAAFMAASIIAGDAGSALKMYSANRTKLTQAKEWQPAFRFLIGHMDHPGR